MTVNSTAAKLAICLLGIVALGFLAAYKYMGVDGEVFLVTDQGRAQPAPGASVFAYRSTRQVNLRGFNETESQLRQKYTDRVKKASNKYLPLQGVLIQREKLAQAGVVADSLLEEMPGAALSFCMDLRSEEAKFFRQPVEEVNADRNGRFSLRLLPGKYVLLVSGQAGNEHAEWLREVTVVWRSQVRMVDPVCRY